MKFNTIIDEKNDTVKLEQQLQQESEFLELIGESGDVYEYRKKSNIKFAYDTSTRRLLEEKKTLCDLTNEVTVIITPTIFPESFIVKNKTINCEYRELEAFMKHAKLKYPPRAENIEKSIASYIQTVLNISNCDIDKCFEIWNKIWSFYDRDALLFKILLENISSANLSQEQLVEFDVFTFFNNLSTYYLIDEINSLEKELMREKDKLVELELTSKKNFYTYFIGILIVSVPLIPILYDIYENVTRVGYVFFISFVALIVGFITRIIYKILISEKQALYPRAEKCSSKIEKYKFEDNIDLSEYEYEKYERYVKVSNYVIAISLIATIISILID